ncbi:MAG: prepilin-type N-terminal cleavage/methylation domain-containing protein [Planctomycetes bacterium]|nr:prepilin-type N-terminal cleavage/methylation domain-containing protein [Planctomycetota bacterium]
MKTERRRNQGGFTLIEILVVVVIVGVLATLVVQNLSGTQEQANLAATQSDIAAIDAAATRYKLNNGKWPESIDELVGTDDATIRYLDEAPVDKWTGAPYTIERSGGGIIVICAGADGEVGGDDDLTSENIKKMKLAEYLEIIKQGS